MCRRASRRGAIGLGVYHGIQIMRFVEMMRCIAEIQSPATPCSLRLTYFVGGQDF